MLPVPPVIEEHGITDFTVLKGAEVRLPCETSGDPSPRVEWLKGRIPHKSSIETVTPPHASSRKSLKVLTVEVKVIFSVFWQYFY